MMMKEGNFCFKVKKEGGKKEIKEILPHSGVSVTHRRW